MTRRRRTRKRSGLGLDSLAVKAYQAHAIQLFAAILKECVRQITNL
jgi:hypothetical protein